MSAFIDLLVFPSHLEHDFSDQDKVWTIISAYVTRRIGRKCFVLYPFYWLADPSRFGCLHSVLLIAPDYSFCTKHQEGEINGFAYWFMYAPKMTKKKRENIVKNEDLGMEVFLLCLFGLFHMVFK